MKSAKCLQHLQHISEKDWILFKNLNEICIREGMEEIRHSRKRTQSYGPVFES